MTDEMSIRLQLNVSNGEFVDSLAESFTADFPIIGKGGGIQIIGTAEEAISFGDILYEGWTLLKNLDDTNIIDYGPDSTGMVACLRLDPGEAAMFRLKPGVTIKAKARTAACRLLVACFDTATST